MKIQLDKIGGLYTFIPTSDHEIKVLSDLRKILKAGDRVAYAGRETDDVIDGRTYMALHFYAGAIKTTKTIIYQKATVTWPDYVGGVQLILRGSEVEDKNLVCRIRDACYFGSAGIIFHSTMEIDNVTALRFTLMHCKHCGGNMTETLECEWGVCDVCANKCEHKFTRGFMHSEGIEIINDVIYCETCGRVRPK